MRRYAILAALFGSLGYGVHWYQTPKRVDPAPPPVPAPVEPPPPDPGLSARIDGVDQRFDGLVPEVAATRKAVTDLQGKADALAREQSMLSRLTGENSVEIDSLKADLKAARDEAAAATRGLTDLQARVAAMPAIHFSELTGRLGVAERTIGNLRTDLDDAEAEIARVKARVPVLRPGESFLIRSPYAER